MKAMAPAGGTIPIWLVVGFLGVGKTTLLKRLIHSPQGREYIYIVNEFAAVDVDAGQIEREGGVVITVAGGSIFSRRLQAEFVGVMQRIQAGFRVGELIVRAEGVVVEASGMADPRSMQKLLTESHLDDTFHLAYVTAVVDPGILMRLLLLLPNIKGQIQVADLILFNKTELRSRQMIDKVKEKVVDINPRAEIVECVGCEIDTELVLRGGSSEAVKIGDADYNLCQDPHYVNQTLRLAQKIVLSELLEILPASIEGLYRVKGCVETTEGWFFVDWSEGGLAYQAALPQSASTLTVIWSAAADPAVVGKLRYLAL